MKISVVICTKNEEWNIERCLQAVERIADEVIVVDSYSTDATEKICRGFAKVRFYQTEWQGYSQTKNYANSLATGDYILSLDADEVLSSEIQNEILRLKPQLNGIYSINRLTNYCGQWIKYSGWFPDRHNRLFPRGRAEWEGDIHERLRTQHSLPVTPLKGLVYHYSYYSVEEHIERIERYSSLGARQLLKKNKRFLLPSCFINPISRFLKCYIFKLGFLDGRYGFVIATLSARAVFLKYYKAFRAKAAGQ